MLQVIQPVSLVHSPIRMPVNSIPISLIALPLPVKNISINMAELALSRRFVCLPHAVVFCTVRPFFRVPFHSPVYLAPFLNTTSPRLSIIASEALSCSVSSINDKIYRYYLILSNSCSTGGGLFVVEQGASDGSSHLVPRLGVELLHGDPFSGH
jgi:hypothetical protein